MADDADQAALAPGSADSPADFLRNLGTTLREKQGVDVDLAVILAEHLLTAAPAADAVIKAKNAITKLAVTRATPEQEATDAR